MKILLVNNYPFLKGGAERVLFDQYELLKSRGHEVIVFSRDFENLNSINYYKFQKRQFFFNRFYSFESKRKIKEILVREKPDIVHIHNIVGEITFSILPVIKEFNIPIVATIHDFRLLCPVTVMINGKGEICEKCIKHKYYEAILNKCHPEGYLKSAMVAMESYLRDLFLPHHKFIDAYIFVSNFTKKKFLESLPDLKLRSFVLYNFNQTYNSNIIRGDYFLYFGRYEREKGLITLLQAFSELSNFRLILLGDGQYRNIIKKYTSSNQNINELGFKSGDELQDYIQNSEFVIISSECYENLPMSAVQALSLSKPIITTSLGGLKELLNNNLNGFEFKARDVEDLKKVILQAKSISDIEYYRMANNAYRFAIEHFNVEKFYVNLIKIYQKVVDNK